MVFHVLTLFPQMVKDALSYSILKRAMDRGKIEINCIDIRDFSSGKHGQVDDAPYGGGAGMVMMAPPIYGAWLAAKALAEPDAKVVYMSPRGRMFTQRVAEEFCRRESLILLCGHYEGVDQRALDAMDADEVSVGDYVLTGGEIAAMAVIDAVARLIPGVLGKCESYQHESFSDGLLEHPQYTRPPVFLDMPVPEVLLSGHHKNIAAWRREKSLEQTAKTRPELLLPDVQFLAKGSEPGKAAEKREESAHSKRRVNMKGIITVLGNDQVGIIAKVCTYLSNEGINILDISQTIVQGYFHMMMIVDITNSMQGFEGCVEDLRLIGEDIGVQIKLQHEDIFNSMHRI
ncbi:MAG: tRNA (guanosine(37)-N1)-methyltransferase TrmD [Clostridiales bacterium]|jgi:tRNA (guanine37-N1)-methyltransferase|nr:tRNA (guanosine(37)-N1)-methyltransferase TrmD [Clostridiales bacterium]